MNAGIRICVALTAVLGGPVAAVEPSTRITVLIYNYAPIPSGGLAHAEAEAARIYQHCRIEIRWLDCPLTAREAHRFPSCQIPYGSTWLALRILRRPIAERGRAPQESFGFALYPEHGAFPIYANVYGQDAEQLGKTLRMRQGVILGHVMAHELAHLLLGPQSHSKSGIMRSSWHTKELQIISQGLMLFTPGQSEKMRTNIQARVAEGRVEQVALVPPM